MGCGVRKPRLNRFRAAARDMTTETTPAVSCCSGRRAAAERVATRARRPADRIRARGPYTCAGGLRAAARGPDGCKGARADAGLRDAACGPHPARGPHT